MTDEPYRWLEAIGNRREYVQNQIKDGSPVLAVALDDGIVLFGVGTGQSKVFEIYDRHALAGLGHPADLERVRQGLIDAAHLEGFARSPEDVALRRLVSFGLSPQLKTAFEQIFTPPFLVRLLLAEVGESLARDTLVKVGFDGTFAITPGPVAVVSGEANPETETRLEKWLRARIPTSTPPATALPTLATAWEHLARGTALPETEVALDPSRLAPLQVEAALLRRNAPTTAHYHVLTAP